LSSALNLPAAGAPRVLQPLLGTLAHYAEIHGAARCPVIFDNCGQGALRTGSTRCSATMELNTQIKKPRLFSLTLVMLAMLITSPTLGAIDAFSAYRNQDLKAALTAIGIYLVAAPLIALWWLHRHPVSRDSRRGDRRARGTSWINS